MLTKRRRDTSIVAKSHCRVSVRGFSIEHTLFPYGELGSGLVMLQSFVSECSESLLHDVSPALDSFASSVNQRKIALVNQLYNLIENFPLAKDVSQSFRHLFTIKFITSNFL